VPLVLVLLLPPPPLLLLLLSLLLQVAVPVQPLAAARLTLERAPYLFTT
jgi:hypothetical protein